jgi:Prealbumin-like fold domain
MIFSLLLLILSFFIITSFPIISFAQQSNVQVPTIAQIPSVEEQSQLGFLIITTNVINDNGGTKQESDFTINMLGSQSFPSSFQSTPSIPVQIISIKEGQYSISVDNTQGYKISFGNQCEGQIKAGDKKSCSITLDDSPTKKKRTSEPMPIFPLSLPSLPSKSQTSGEERLTISQIPSAEEQSQLGFLILATHVINDNGGMKQASNFKINMLGSQSFPSSFQAASSNLMQIISIKEGQYSISVDNTQGYKISFGNQCEGQIKLHQIKTCLITLDDLPSTTPPPPILDPIAKLVAPLQVQGGQTVVLDGSQSVADTLTITQTAGQPVTLTDIGTFKKQFIAPNGNFQLGFQAIAQKGNKQTITQVSIQVSTNLPPPTGGVFPVPNVVWFYDSQPSLTKDMVLKSSQTHPTDRVLFPSSASGTSSHPIKNGWLEVQSGGGNGRVYWNYHEVPQFSQLPTAGFNTAMTGTFMFKPGIDNLSIKDGNHGTNGWVLEDDLVFGGFGLAFHRTNVESKAEYWHNNQGKGITIAYPSGLKLVDNKEYKFFLTLVTDRVKQEVVLNAWLDFGDGKGWVQVMKDRKWGQSGWDPGSVPNGNDKADIEKGPSFIKKHHIWTRANGDSFLPVKDIKIGTLDFLS